MRKLRRMRKGKRGGGRGGRRPSQEGGAPGASVWESLKASGEPHSDASRDGASQPNGPELMLDGRAPAAPSGRAELFSAASGRPCTR